MNKIRIDTLLVSKGYYDSREKAKANILEGNIYVDGQLVDKVGTKVSESSKITIKGNAIPFVSRGGLKLEKALNVFNISCYNKIAMDIGASTGGFTDCLLQKGAKKVYAIDVGYGQLDWKLRNDKRVINMERTNARYLKREAIEDKIDIVTIDVSFISIKKIVPVAIQFIDNSGVIISLIKPQFEAGKELVGKNGVVRDEKTHITVIKDVLSDVCIDGISAEGLTYSPIKGPAGNIEFLVYLKKDGESPALKDIEKVVTDAHNSL